MKDIKKFQQMYRDGGINRREFLAALGALGVTASAAGSFLTSSSALALTPKKGGSITVSSNLHGPDDQMDPIVFTSGIDYARGRTIYNNLVQIKEGMTVAPELAEEWSLNSNATEFTFKIRRGVKFHDGAPMTADDVVWSMNRHLGEESPSVAKSFFASVKEWKKVDSHTVKAILNSPDADLIIKLTEKQCKIVKKDTTDFRKGNGTGPFTTVSFQPGVKSVHKRNEDYWREPAYLESIEITAITDPIARVNALIAGDVHLINQVDTKGVKLIDRSNGVHVQSTPSGLYGGICCLKNTHPGENDDFVMGLRYIQDRERIVRSILKGHGQVGNDHPISPAYGPDHCAELPQRTYDPDKARFHLKKSGINEATLFVAPLIGGMEDTCLLMQANLNKIGFKLNLKRVPTDGYWGAVWMKEPLNCVTWNMRPTANTMLGIQFGPGAPWNDTFWNDPRMGDLLKAQLGATDPAKRHELLCEMQTLVHNDAGMVIPTHVNVLDGVNDKLMGVPKIPIATLGGSEFAEFAWLNT